MVAAAEGKITVSDTIGEVSTIFLRPAEARWLFVLAHGAGADMRHRALEATAKALANNGVATFRFNFPYRERGDWRIDPPAVATATVRAAVNEARTVAPDLPLLAGGRSFGGRMTSTAEAETHLEGVRGLVFYGFPLHRAGKPSVERAEHLDAVTVPMLFLQGSSDALAELHLLERVIERLGDRAALNVFKGADHSFKTPKRLGISEGQLLHEAAQLVVRFADSRC